MDGIKKALKLIGIFILSFMVIFLIVIWAAPEQVSIENQVNVKASSSDVWDFLTDRDHLGDWMTNFDSLAGEKDFREKGDSFTLFMFNGEKRSMMNLEVIQSSKPSEFFYSTDIKNALNTVYEFRLQETGDSTTIIQNTVVNADSWVIQLFLFNAEERMHQQFDTDLLALKKAVEKEVASEH